MESQVRQTVVRQGGGCRVIVRTKSPGMIQMRKGHAVSFTTGVAPIRKAA